MCHTFTCLSIHLHKGYASNLANQAVSRLLPTYLGWVFDDSGWEQQSECSRTSTL